MIVGTGCDITEIERIKKASANAAFMRRAFSQKEIERFEKMRSPYSSMAGAWAAKEAFAKALGTGVRGFSLSEITVSHDDLGKPYLELEKNAAYALNGLVSGSAVLHISISHCSDHATAFCVIEDRS